MPSHRISADMTPPLLSDICERLVQLKLPSVQLLANGLHTDELDSLLQRLPVKLTEETYLYYQWRNGLPANQANFNPFFPTGYFLSLEQSIGFYTEFVRQARELASETGQDTSWFWDSRWLPIFHDGGHHYHVVLCSPTDQEMSPVFSIEYESPGSEYWAYDSLTSLLTTVLTAYETGAYSLEEDGVFIREDRAKLLAITDLYNPQRRKYLLASSGGATTIRELVTNLADSNAEVANKAVLALMLLGDESVVQPLIAQLQHPKPMARNLTLRALGEIGDSRAVDALLWIAANDPLKAVQQNAETALHQIRSRLMG